MKTLVVRRGIFLSLGIVVLLLFIFIFAVNDPDDSSDILSDSSRRLPKSQNPNQSGDLENVQMDRPDVQAQGSTDQTEPGPTKLRNSRTKSDRSVPGSGGPWIPVQADETSQEQEQLNGLESQLGALHENVEEFSNLNRDDTQGWCYIDNIDVDDLICW